MSAMPTLGTHLPQGPFIWNPHTQGPSFQASFSQGPDMFLPNPQMVWGQGPHPQMGRMENQGDCMQNPQLQVHMPHAPLAPYAITYPTQQTYIRNLDEGACTQNFPREMEGPIEGSWCMQEPATGPFVQYFLA